MAGNKRRALGRAALPLSLAALIAIALAALSLGAVRVNVFQALMGADATGAVILRHVRLPRVLATLLSGAALATAGVILQSVLHNALAAPNIIGVNAGAGFGVTLCLALAPGATALAAGASAFAGAVAAALLVCGIARKAGSSRLSLVLSGVAISMLFSADLDALTTLWPDCLAASNQFKIGSAANVTLRAVLPAAVLTPVCVAAAWLMHNELDVLSLGDETAQSLGLNPARLRPVFLGLSCALAASAVSVMGLIGFVGLLTPHIARLWVGEEHRLSLPLSATLGAAFLTLCDLAARTIFSPFELPVGIVLSALGAPFFLWLLVRRRAHD